MNEQILFEEYKKYDTANVTDIDNINVVNVIYK